MNSYSNPLDLMLPECVAREIAYEAAQHGIAPEEIIQAMSDDAVVEAEIIEDLAAKIAAKDKRLLAWPVTRDDVLKAADEVVEVARANNTTPEAVIKEVAKERPKTTVKIKVFND